MTNLNTSSRPIWLHWLIPYIAAMSFILISVSLRLFFLYDQNQVFLDFLNKASLWLLLAFDLIAAMIIGTAIYIIQQITIDNLAMQKIIEDSEKEMAKLIKSEEVKQNLEKALLQGQKLQAIGTLAGGVAHDFNNILYAIKGYVEMAREDLEKGTLIHRNLGKVLEAADRGRELISRILAFSRRQHLDYKPINLQNTIENVLALLKPTIPASVTIQLKPMLQEFFITGNQTQLHQVIVNLVNNAVDAMDGEGTITFDVSQARPNDELFKKILNDTHVPYCRIDITDTGCGMDQATMQRIFEPFYTTKEVGKGTGLGLSTVYSIVHNHQGFIMVNSKLGQGTTFTILLPMLTIPAYDEIGK